MKIKTTQGTIVVELFSDVPTTTQNFVDLVSKGFYDGLTFHRYVPGFVIQGGDPTGTGNVGSDKSIPLEITAHKHVKGALGMARTNDPNSATSQFYICLDDLPQLDGGYTTFGKLIKGDDVLTKLGKTPVKPNAQGEPSWPINRVSLVSVKIVPAGSVK